MLESYLTIKDEGEHEIVIQNPDLSVMSNEQKLQKKHNNSSSKLKEALPSDPQLLSIYDWRTKSDPKSE